ncbi:PREDICTED: uncharacterized protein LOC109230257 [Nicotiana attenuata]|uniref:uncharacterized protein LOC109230257 n=1 Tax=Nicotiana attenuata TaxID=49451 RepID=UPI00090516C9|nr:PREDICTED: uncharacterized protein LOC109230257 [Nicotiana attenuata]
MGSLAHIEADKRTMMKEVHRLASLGVRLLDSEDGGVVLQKRVESSLVAEVKEKQFSDPYLLQLKEEIHKHKTTTFERGGDDGTLRYRGRICVPDVDGLRELIMSEAHNSSYHSSIKMAPYEALYGQRCRSQIGWFEVREAELLGPDLVYQAMEKVNLMQKHLKTAQSRQKSYLNVRRRDVEFQVDDWKFMGDPSLMVPTEIIGVKDSLTYEEILVAILDRQIRKLRIKEIASVKVLWRNQNIEKAMWEDEEDMKSRYPHVFEEQTENVEVFTQLSIQ